MKAASAIDKAFNSMPAVGCTGKEKLLLKRSSAAKLSWWGLAWATLFKNGRRSSQYGIMLELDSTGSVAQYQSMVPLTFETVPSVKATRRIT